MKQQWSILAVPVVAIALTLCGSARAADDVAQRALLNRTSGKALIDRNAQGRVAHLRAASAPIAVDATLNPDARARKVLSQYREAFVDSSVPLDLVTKRVSAPDSAGRSHVRYRQRVNGIPVRGGEVIVHLDKRGVTAIHSKLISDLDDVVTVPEVASEQAVAAAQAAITKLFPRARASLAVPRLEIINVDQLRGVTGGRSRLAWFTEALGRGVAENIWIDAQTGDVLLHFSQIAHAFAVTDYAGSCLDPAPANPAYYDQDTPAPSGSEAEAALVNMAAAYNYYNDQLGQQGFNDTNTVSQSAVVRVCTDEPELSAVPEKAEWHLGQMTFATGIATADDIVGHEYSHGVVEYSARLNLLMQSGALAEGFADALGETIDLLQNTANDSGDARWAFGEDASGGPFRNLQSPGDNGLPGKVSDANFYCGTDNSTWIHKNGAVIAHAFALLADGGDYNGFTISGIGIQKAVRIFYETVIGRLPETSSFHDAYQGFKAAADALVTSGDITSADRAQLAKVLDAVELASQPCATKINYCPAGQTPIELFTDGFEVTTSGQWSNEVSSGVNHWSDFGATGAIAVGAPPIYYPADGSKGVDSTDAAGAIGILPARGTYALWGSAGKLPDVVARLGDSNVAMVNGVSIPAGSNARMQFEGRFQFGSVSPYYYPDVDAEITKGEDGAVIEYSVNGGAWQDAGSLISGGQGYSGRISASQGNPLGDRSAFVGASPNKGYVSTQLDLSGSAIAGQSVRFRFRVGTDDFDDYMGWQIDDVSIYTCTDAALIVTPTEGLTTSESGGTATFTVRLGGAPTSSVTVTIASNDTTEGSVSPAELTFDATNYSQEQQVVVTGVDDSDRDGPVDYTVTVSVLQTSDPGYQVAPSVDVALTNSNNDKKKGGGAANLWALGVLLSLVLTRFGIRRRAHPAALRH